MKYMITALVLALFSMQTPFNSGHLAFTEKDDPAQDSGLVEKYWKLVSMNDLPIVSRDDRQSEPHMILKTLKNEVRGNGGCNSFTATYNIIGEDSVAITKFLAKEEPCKNISSERRFFKFLNKVSNFKVNGDTLYMKDATGKLTAKFEAVYLD